MINSVYRDDGEMELYEEVHVCVYDGGGPFFGLQIVAHDRFVCMFYMSLFGVTLLHGVCCVKKVATQAANMVIVPRKHRVLRTFPS